MPVRFDLAQPCDDAALRRLMAEIPMGRRMRISFRREPDFFIGSGVQGGFCQVVVGRNGAGEIIGFGTRAVRPAFINGRVEPAGYLGDLRLLPEYRGGTLVARGYRYFRRLHQDGRARLYFTVIFEDNRNALGTIATGRAGLPAYHDLGGLVTPALWLRKRLRPAPGDGCRIARAGEITPEIIECLNRNARRFQFAPVHCPADLSDSASRLRRAGRLELYVALRGGRVAGVMGLWDQRAFKQTVVMGYDPLLRCLRPLLRLGAALWSAPPLPTPGTPVNACYACFRAVDGDDLEVARALLRRLYDDAAAKGFDYLYTGFHQDDPLLPILDGYSRVAFTGRLFCVCPDDDQAVRELDGRVPYIELAML